MTPTTAAEVLKRHQTIRLYLPIFSEVIEFGTVNGSQLIIELVRLLPELRTRSK
jgi:hypothetical protein